MASCEIKNPPGFTVEVEKWNRETLADGAAMGAEMEKLLNNTYYNKIQAEQLEEGKVGRNGGDISETIVKTLEAPQEEFPVPQAGEGAKTFFGKVKKSLEDWKNFKDGIITLGKLVNNGQCTEPGFALDARYGKTLAEQVAQLNSNLTISDNLYNYDSILSWALANPGKKARYRGGGSLTDTPGLTSWGVIESHGIASQYGLRVEIYVNSNNLVYTRPIYGSTWGANWDKYSLASNMATIQVGSDYAVTDCNNVIPGQMAYVYAAAAHAPSGNKSWNVWCTGLDAFRMQIAINVTTNVPIMMIRSSHTGVWSDWVEK